jgi:hypothetical protein
MKICLWKEAQREVRPHWFIPEYIAAYIQVLYKGGAVHPTGLTVNQGCRQLSTCSKFLNFMVLPYSTKYTIVFAVPLFYCLVIRHSIVFCRFVVFAVPLFYLFIRRSVFRRFGYSSFWYSTSCSTITVLTQYSYIANCPLRTAAIVYDHSHTIKIECKCKVLFYCCMCLNFFPWSKHPISSYLLSERGRHLILGMSLIKNLIRSQSLKTYLALRALTI